MSHDVWQYGIVIFVCLTGCLPWQKAAPDDPRYVRYCHWHGSNGVMMQVRRPKMFKVLSSRAQRMFRKYLEPRPAKRPQSLGDSYRYLEDRWLTKSGVDKSNAESAEDDGLCPSMYSFHSSQEEKDKLLMTLAEYGLETTVDRVAKKDRIKEWIQNSVIEEEPDEPEIDPEERCERDAMDRKREELRRERGSSDTTVNSSRPDSTSR